MSLKVWSLIGLAVAVAAIVTLLFLESLFALEPIGITVQVLAALLMIWARVTFGRRSFHATANPTEGGLVTTGPYRYIRHPIYAAIIYFAWAGVLSHISFLSIALGLCLILGLSVRIVLEEHLVRERYPEYETYAARTKRIVPFVL